MKAMHQKRVLYTAAKPEIKVVHFYNNRPEKTTYKEYDARIETVSCCKDLLSDGEYYTIGIIL